MNRLLRLLENTLPTVNFRTEKELVSSGLIDSLGIITIISAISDEYGIELSLDDLSIENFNTVENIASMLKRHGIE